MIKKDSIENCRVVRSLFFLTSPFLLYLPVINKYFVSDDFKVLNRVCLDQIILIKRFFRPLSDITIYFNYLIGGFDPVIFNSFNLLVHGANSRLLYALCVKIQVTSNSALNKQFAFISGVLFLTYPFHNEGIVWLLGRGASMSCGFALAGMLTMLSNFNLLKRILLTCSFYFIGLLAYESIIFFPVIILIMAVLRRKSLREKILWLFSLLLTLILHIIARMLISGSIAGSYGGSFFRSEPVNYLLNIAKTAARLILPPTGNMHWLVSAYVVILIAICMLIVFLIRSLRNKAFMKTLKGLFLCLCITCITPVFAGVSTITSESDRMLYFPSLFLCMIVSMLITFFMTSSYRKLLVCSLLLVYNIFFLESNNFNWVLAGKTSQSLVNFLKNAPGKTYVLDMPEEYRGAYIFRQGLNDALRINSIDTSKVEVLNYLTRTQVDLPALSTVRQSLPVLNKNDKAVYWNRRSFVSLHSKPGR